VQVTPSVQGEHVSLMFQTLEKCVEQVVSRLLPPEIMSCPGLYRQKMWRAPHTTTRNGSFPACYSQKYCLIPLLPREMSRSLHITPPKNSVVFRTLPPGIGRVPDTTARKCVVPRTLPREMDRAPHAAARNSVVYRYYREKWYRVPVTTARNVDCPGRSALFGHGRYPPPCHTSPPRRTE